MATPTIIIGIGSTGLDVLENIQQQYFESYRENRPGNVEYLYIETNEKKRPLGTPKGNDISRVYIALDNIPDMISYLKQTCNDPKWLPDSKIVINAGAGAGGMRSCGRLALWGHHHGGDNFENVLNAIDGAYRRVKNITNTEDDSRVTVFIVGSLSGGTGSGIFIDLAYIVRHLISGIKNVFGLFLLESRPISIAKKQTRYGNVYGAIKDLEFFNKVETVYAEKWPNGFDKNYSDPPYKLVQFITQDYQDGNPAISDLKGVVKMAGLYLFLNIAGIWEKRDERLVDAWESGSMGKYGTFGLSAIQYPKSQIQEYIASEFSIQLLKKLTNSEEYYKNGNKQKIIRASIKQKISIEWDNIIEEAFATVNSVAGTDLLREIEKDTLKINKKDIKGNTIDYIVSRFTSNRNDNYYAMVNNNIKSAVEIIIDRIYEQVDQGLQNTENIYYAKYILEDTVEVIEKTLNFWRSKDFSSVPANWENSLRSLALGCTQQKYVSILEHNSVLFDRLKNILELMKIHLIIKSLVDIQNNIIKGSISMKGMNHYLPKNNFFNNLINNINSLIGHDNEKEKKDPTKPDEEPVNFLKRLRDIEADINDTTLPIQKVYPSNSFHEECKIGVSKYNQTTNNSIRSMREVIDLNNIWEYFSHIDSKRFNETVYLDFLKAFRVKINDSNCVADFDITSYVKNNINKSANTAKRATSPFLKITKVLPPNPQIPRFIIGSEGNFINEVIDEFHLNTFTDFKNNNGDGVCVLPDLKNILLFYDEKGNFDIMKHLDYIDLMKKSYEELPADTEDPEMTQERWVNGRNAYKNN